MTLYDSSKRYLLGLFGLILPVFLFAQTQYDYMDDAVAGGADRALSGIITIIGLIILAIILITVLGGALNVYYWFNPKANPDYKKAKRVEEKKKEEERIITQKRKEAVPEAIDLGLSVKWASFNLGAYRPNDIGDTFHWGEIHPSTSRKIKPQKINVNSLGDICGNPEYDAATNCIGKNWRMPTPTECKELLEQCSWETKVIDNIEGRLVTGATGNSIFLPYNQINFVTNKLESGKYWTSYPSFNSRANDTAQDFRFGEGCQFPAEICNRATASTCLFGIRAVYDPSKRRTEEEKKEETLNSFSQIITIKNDDLDSLYEYFEEQCIVRECEKRLLYDTDEVFKNSTFTDEYGVVYSIDGKRLLYGGDCSCETYYIREGTEFICCGAFCNSARHFSYMFPQEKTLKRIVIPSTLLFLEESSISDNCEIESFSPYYKIINKLIIDNRKKSVVKCTDKFIKEVIIGAPIEEIGDKAFINCEVLQKVSLPDSLKVINKNSFRNNELLRSINLPDSIEVIDEYAFWGCKSLHIINLPKNLISIGDSAFSRCNIENVVIPQFIKHIGNAPFPMNISNIQSQSERFVIEEGLLIDKLERTIIQSLDSTTS